MSSNWGKEAGSIGQRVRKPVNVCEDVEDYCHSKDIELCPKRAGKQCILYSFHSTFAMTYSSNSQKNFFSSGTAILFHFYPRIVVFNMGGEVKSSG